MPLMAEERALFSVFLRMLDENALPAEIKEQIRDGNWAQGAVRIVIDNHIDLFEQMEDDYLRERRGLKRSRTTDFGLFARSRLQPP